MILPGSSSRSGLISVPWSAASVRSTLRARPGAKAQHLARRDQGRSRPKMVANQGIPCIDEAVDGVRGADLGRHGQHEDVGDCLSDDRVQPVVGRVHRRELRLPEPMLPLPYRFRPGEDRAAGAPAPRRSGRRSRPPPPAPPRARDEVERGLLSLPADVRTRDLAAGRAPDAVEPVVGEHQAPPSTCGGSHVPRGHAPGLAPGRRRRSRPTGAARAAWSAGRAMKLCSTKRTRSCGSQSSVVRRMESVERDVKRPSSPTSLLVRFATARRFVRRHGRGQEERRATARQQLELCRGGACRGRRASSSVEGNVTR